jgi:hypothetical protein
VWWHEVGVEVSGGVCLVASPQYEKIEKWEKGCGGAHKE